MHILQITDLHIPPEGELFYEFDVRSSFLNSLEKIRKESADLLIVSGDLCYKDGKQHIYEWIYKGLETLPFPTLVLSGNHDNALIMTAVFGQSNDLKNKELFYKRSFPEGNILFLDSTIGRISQQQLDWLKHELSIDKSSLLFVHHPITLCGSPLMDTQHPLQNRVVIQAILQQAEHPPQAVFSGHYHTEKTIMVNGIPQFITPSFSYFQISTKTPEFSIASIRSGWRHIFWNGQQVNTHVSYYDL